MDLLQVHTAPQKRCCVCAPRRKAKDLLVDVKDFTENSEGACNSNARQVCTRSKLFTLDNTQSSSQVYNVTADGRGGHGGAKRNDKDKICFRFRKKGRCKHGDQCKFSHDPSRIQEPWRAPATQQYANQPMPAPQYPQQYGNQPMPMSYIMCR